MKIKNKSEYIKNRNALCRKLKMLKSMIDNSYHVKIDFLVFCLMKNSWANYNIHNVDYSFIFDCNLTQIGKEIQDLEQCIIRLPFESGDYIEKYKLVNDISYTLSHVIKNKNLKPLHLYAIDLYHALDDLCNPRNMTTINIYIRYRNMINAVMKINHNDTTLSLVNRIYNDILDLYVIVNGFKFETI